MFFYSTLNQISIPAIGNLDDFPCFPTRYGAYKYRCGDSKVIPVAISGCCDNLTVRYYVVSGHFYRAIKKYNNISLEVSLNEDLCNF